MRQSQILNLCILAIILLSLPSCQKVIQVDLNSVDPRLVIEANISDQPGPYIVKLSRTVNFDEDNIFPAVTAARIIISSNTGQPDTLSETSAGIYKTHSLQGVPGTTYNLSVLAGENTYQSTGAMNLPVDIDTLIVQNTTGGPGSGGPGAGGKNKQVKVLFKDPAGFVNFYRLVMKVNDSVLNSIQVTTDQFRDGENFTVTMRMEKSEIHPGDSVRVYLQNIDKKMYDYFRALSSEGGPMQQSGTPSNPPNNLTGGALGYFNVYAITSKAIKVP